MDQIDKDFDLALEAAKERVHKQFCDNFNTPGVIDALDETIKKANNYIANPNHKITLLIKALQTLSKPFEDMGFQYQTEESNDSKNREIIDAVVKFRSNIRQNAKSDFKKILEICDTFRDQEMVDLEIRVEDKQISEPSTWRY